jgi:hypothetical protein
MRKIYVLLMLIGLACGVGYPWYFNNLSGSNIGTYPVYKRTLGFQVAKVVLSSDQSPVRVFVDMTPVSGYYTVLTRTMLTLTASTDGKTMFASTLDFVSTSKESENLQTTDKIFRDQAGDMMIVQPGEYTFVVGEGDVEGLSMKSVNLVLRANAQDPDPRVQPVGIALFVLGLFGFIRSLHRDDRQEAATSEAPKQPEKSKWGRDAAGE